MTFESAANGSAGRLIRKNARVTIALALLLAAGAAQAHGDAGHGGKSALLHEMVLGTKQELDAHAALMRKFPNMEHDGPYMAHVRPATAGALVWNFNRPGQFEYACLIDGHYQAGMKGRISVTASGFRKTPRKAAS